MAFVRSSIKEHPHVFGHTNIKNISSDQFQGHFCHLEIILISALGDWEEFFVPSLSSSQTLVQLAAIGAMVAITIQMEFQFLVPELLFFSEEDEGATTGIAYALLVKVMRDKGACGSLSPGISNNGSAINPNLWSGTPMYAHLGRKEQGSETPWNFKWLGKSWASTVAGMLDIPRVLVVQV